MCANKWTIVIFEGVCVNRNSLCSYIEEDALLKKLRAKTLGIAFVQSF